ncbi:MAG TPA: LuxR C-terminal-related transcriptional regulator, partial [Longimicrobiales bacterium]|nr:LuxR C-terminal-related transcriptional regulator [Longimicrobiales bacterium]
LAVAAYLVGDEEGFLEALREAHQAFLAADDALEAVRAAFWIGQHLAGRGELGRASGWFGRAARVVQEREAEGAARGYVLLPAGLKQLETGEHEASVETCSQAAEIGRRCRDEDLTALALHVQGRALLRLGRLEEGLALLDEAMVAAASQELSPITTGLLYCSVISACGEVYALRRAQEWTAALADWCEEQPQMIAYTGPCLVSRAEILQRRGEWSRAMEEAEMALERFERGAGPGTAGPALYQKGELHRLRGEYAAAESAYKAASRAGREPQPGLALLRMAQGEPEKAAASLRRGLGEARGPLRRARLLPAYVEVLLCLGDVKAASRACDDLDEVASAWSGRVLAALAAQARGSTKLAADDPEGALALLRSACEEWEALDAPYEVARTRMSLAEACRALGDEEGAALELGGAQDAFTRLGASEAAGGGATAGQDATDHRLTPREREVLAWLATGRTNRAIAEALFISEKTVARHVANIYAKLGLSSRAAATAYAYEHALLRTST